MVASEEFYDGKTFRLKSGAMGNLPAFGGISDYEYMERLLSDREPPSAKQQLPQKREQSPYEKYAALDPTGIRAIIEYIKPRWDSMQPKIRELFQQNCKNENYFANKNRSAAKLEFQCTFCGQVKEWKYDEIQSHIESHDVFKALIEKIRVASKREGELYAKKHAAQRKLQISQAEYDKAKDIAESPQWDFFAIGAAKHYLTYKTRKELDLI